MQEYSALIPALIVLINGLVFMLLAPFSSIGREFAIKLNIVVLSIALLVQVFSISLASNVGDLIILNEMLFLDKLGGFFNALFILFGIIFSFSSYYYFKNDYYFKVEYIAMSNFAIFGMVFMGSSAELLSALIGLEIASLALYTLVGFNTKNEISNEALLKYFLLGSFAGSFYLFGTAFVYGAVGSTKFVDIANYIALSGDYDVLLYIGMLFILVTLFFKISAFGFYNWAIDTYFGSGVSVTGFLSTAVKIASFTLLIRIVVIGFDGLQFIWQPIIYGIAVLTMFAGNFMSIKQTNIKKLLIASSIVHSGYIMVNIASVYDGKLQSYAPSLFYLVAYTVAVSGMFIILSAICNKDESNLHIDNFKGLSRYNPVLSLTILIFMLSFIGFPYTVGFFGKFHLFSSAIVNEKTVLALIGMINTIISVYYYLKIIINMYFYQPEEKFDFQPSFVFKFVVISIMLVVLMGGFGIYTISDIINIIV